MMGNSVLPPSKKNRTQRSMKEATRKREELSESSYRRERHANLSSVMEEMPPANERLNKRCLGGNPRISI